MNEAREASGGVPRPEAAEEEGGAGRLRESRSRASVPSVAARAAWARPSGGEPRLGPGRMGYSVIAVDADLEGREPPHLPGRRRRRPCSLADFVAHREEDLGKLLLDDADARPARLIAATRGNLAVRAARPRAPRRSCCASCAPRLRLRADRSRRRHPPGRDGLLHGRETSGTRGDLSRADVGGERLRLPARRLLPTAAARDGLGHDVRKVVTLAMDERNQRGIRTPLDLLRRGSRRIDAARGATLRRRPCAPSGRASSINDVRSGRRREARLLAWQSVCQQVLRDRVGVPGLRDPRRSGSGSAVRSAPDPSLDFEVPSRTAAVYVCNASRASSPAASPGGRAHEAPRGAGPTTRSLELPPTAPRPRTIERAYQRRAWPPMRDGLAGELLDLRRPGRRPTTSASRIDQAYRVLSRRVGGARPTTRRCLSLRRRASRSPSRRPPTSRPYARPTPPSPATSRSFEDPRGRAATDRAARGCVARAHAARSRDRRRRRRITKVRRELPARCLEDERVRGPPRARSTCAASWWPMPGAMGFDPSSEAAEAYMQRYDRAQAEVAGSSGRRASPAPLALVGRHAAARLRLRRRTRERGGLECAGLEASCREVDLLRERRRGAVSTVRPGRTLAGISRSPGPPLDRRRSRVAGVNQRAGPRESLRVAAGDADRGHSRPSPWPSSARCPSRSPLVGAATRTRT